MSVAGSVVSSTGHDASLSKPTLAGWVAILIAFGGIGVWSCTAPLASAIITTGTVVVESDHKIVQHPDGGVIGALYVHDGDQVVAGQPLLTLDDARLAEARSTYRSQLATNVARRARLWAERNQENNVVFPEQASGLVLSEFADTVANQRYLFRARHSALDSKIAALAVEGQEASADLSGLHQQIVAQMTRLQLTETELGNAEGLAHSGFGTRQRVLEISRARAELQSGIAALASQVSEMEHRVERSRIEIERTRATFSEDVETELQQIDRETPEISEKLINTEDQLRRLKILAPVSGWVVNTAVHTVGGVIPPGMPILEVVPDNDRLLIEAQVKPSDALHLREGLAVDVRLEGLASKGLPRLTGHVTMVSADRISDRLRDTSFFVVRVALEGNLYHDLLAQKIKPGMPVDLMIYRGEQTLLSYLLEPMTSLFTKSLRD